MLYKACSKLFLAGEYFILQEGNYALISNVNEYTYLELIKSEKEEIISSIEDKKGLIRYAQDVAFEFLNKRDNFKYIYSSDLYDNGKKKGLGSSGSIVVVTIKAILSYYSYPFTEDELFRLSVKASKRAGLNGSFGDIACICYENLILYQSFKDDKYSIKIIEPKRELKILAVHTGIEKDNTGQIKKARESLNDIKFSKYFNNSKSLVLELVSALENGTDNFYDILDKISDNLYNYGKKAGIDIYTQDIMEVLSKYDNSKVSGSGGGDFIISMKLGEKNVKKGSTHRVFLEKYIK